MTGQRNSTTQTRRTILRTGFGVTAAFIGATTSGTAQTANGIQVEIQDITAYPTQIHVTATVTNFGGYRRFYVAGLITGNEFKSPKKVDATTENSQVTRSNPEFEVRFGANDLDLQTETDYAVQVFALLPSLPRGDRIKSRAYEVRTWANPKADPDGDNLPNRYEATMSTDPGNPDTDGDGWTDGEEYVAETDPCDPDDSP